MPNVQSLIIIHQRQDVAKHTPLQQAVEKFVRLEEITIEEDEYSPTYIRTYSPGIGSPTPWPTYPRSDATATFFHIFLHRVLEVHIRRLRAIHLHTCLPLHPQLFINLRDKALNLRSITFTDNIDAGMEDMFEEPIPWASAQLGHLENLTFRRCSGIDADRLVQNILQGVYGRRLKRVQSIQNGGRVVHVPKPPSSQVFASLERLHYFRINLRELSTIALLPIQDLSLTYITKKAFRKLPMLLEGVSSSSRGRQPGFRGLRRLRLNPNYESEMFLKMLPAKCQAVYKELCERILPQRGIRLSLDWEVI